MTYFIVEAPYEKCFDIFFQNDLGFPNFYRITELLPPQEAYSHLTLIAPYQTKEPSVLERISSKVSKLGMKSLQFGENVDTAFSFDGTGKLHIHPQFEQALHQAVKEFILICPTSNQTSSLQ
jgi:hypothetical protein